ncbi:unnamed protein product [Lampetra planeri]
MTSRSPASIVAHAGSSWTVNVDQEDRRYQGRVELSQTQPLHGQRQLALVLRNVREGDDGFYILESGACSPGEPRKRE